MAIDARPKITPMGADLSCKRRKLNTRTLAAAAETHVTPAADARTEGPVTMWVMAVKM